MIGHLVKRARQGQRHVAIADLDDFFAAQQARIHREILVGRQEDIAIEVSYPREDFVLVENRR